MDGELQPSQGTASSFAEPPTVAHAIRCVAHVRPSQDAKSVIEMITSNVDNLMAELQSATDTLASVRKESLEAEMLLKKKQVKLQEKTSAVSVLRAPGAMYSLARPCTSHCARPLCRA